MGTQGNAYIILIVDGKKEKHLLVNPAHLRTFSPEKKPPKIWKKRTKKVHAPKKTAKKEIKKAVAEPAAKDVVETFEIIETIEEDNDTVLEIIED